METNFEKVKTPKASFTYSSQIAHLQSTKSILASTDIAKAFLLSLENLVLLGTISCTAVYNTLQSTKEVCKVFSYKDMTVLVPSEKLRREMLHSFYNYVFKQHLSNATQIYVFTSLNKNDYIGNFSPIKVVHTSAATRPSGFEYLERGNALAGPEAGCFLRCEAENQALTCFIGITDRDLEIENLRTFESAWNSFDQGTFVYGRGISEIERERPGVTIYI